MNGNCVVCQVEKGKTVPGNPEYAQVHEGRLYLFPGQKQLDMFKNNPAKYAHADLALNGYCPVCLAKGDKLVKGEPSFSASFNGMRYQFPNAKTQGMFRANPAMFAQPEMEMKLEMRLKQRADSEAGKAHSCTECGIGG
jgi:YHS domain-containing protein